MSNILKSENGHGKNHELTKLNPKEVLVCTTLYKFNQLRAYPLDAAAIMEWKDSIFKILGGALDPLMIDFAVDKMLSEEIDYDKGKGIQNIFNALKQVIKTEDGKYKVRDFTW